VVVEDGTAGLGLLGTPVITGDANIQPTGVQGAGQIGAVNVQSGYRVNGIQATGSVGNVIVQINKAVTVTGVSATGRVQTALVWGIINDAQDPNWQVIPT
jgi:hypothetical protein